MILVDHHQDTETVSMTAAVEDIVMTHTATVDPVEMIVAIVAMDAAIVMMDMLHVVLTVMPDAMTDMAVVETTVVEVEVDTLIAMIVEETVEEIAMVDVHPVMSLQQPPMVTQLLAERAGSHMEVEFTMTRNSPVVAIDC
jgi:hypothetical protein